MLHFDPDEKILLVRRKHWFVLLGEVLPLIFMLMLPAAALYTIPLFSVQAHTFLLSIIGEAPAEAIIFFGAFWFLIIWMRIFVAWTNFYLDVWIVTNKRVLDIEQIGLFRREVSTFRFEQLQDITVEIHGLIPTFLNFGNLHVQTAGTSREIFIQGVRSPNSLRDFITLQHDKVLVDKNPKPKDS